MPGLDSWLIGRLEPGPGEGGAGGATPGLELRLLFTWGLTERPEVIGQMVTPLKSLEQPTWRVIFHKM